MKNDIIIRTRPLGFQWETANPFLFCVHHDDVYPRANSEFGPASSLAGRNIGNDFVMKEGWRMYHGQKIPGFPVHPHRGFETVTIVRKGFIDHADSMGAAGRYSAGDVQWMTAGKGVQHAEMFPLLNKTKENPLELFQIWLNLPKKDKFVEPYFRMLWAEDIPTYTSPDKKTKAVVIAGQLYDVKSPDPTPDSWAATPENHVCIYTIHMKANANWTIPGSEHGLNRTLFFFKGSGLKIGGEEIKDYHAVELYSDKDVELQTGSEACELLFLQGRPINEPVVQYGPFVMNTRIEIQQAYEDYQRTEFGGWHWNRTDPIHGAEKKRFAKHADGKVENR
ncbi:pirin family protein [Bacteroidota bacterium]